MTLRLLPFVALVCAAVGCASTGHKSRPGHGMELVVSEAVLVQSFRLGGFCLETPATSDGCLSRYKTLERGPDLSPDQIELLAELVLNRDSYRFEQLKCAFRPTFGFKFISSSGQVDLAVDISVPQWSFYSFSSDSYASSQFTPVANELTSLVRELFPAAGEVGDRLPNNPLQLAARERW